MCGIIGVLNNEKSAELVIKGLEVLKGRGKFGFIIRNEKRDFYSTELQELKELTLLVESKNCIGQCFCFPIEEKQLVSKGRCKFVSDVEVYYLEELKEKYEVDGESDYEVLLGLIEKALPVTKENYIKETFSLKEKLYQKNWFDGVYAFAYWIGDELYIGRDIIGLKSVWYSHRDGFSFASEKKALEALGYPHAIELDPRMFLKYNLKENRFSPLSPR
jgi:asparagine synthase (glutamine-hydrolysing)